MCKKPAAFLPLVFLSNGHNPGSSRALRFFPAASVRQKAAGRVHASFRCLWALISSGRAASGCPVDRLAGRPETVCVATAPIPSKWKRLTLKGKAETRELSWLQWMVFGRSGESGSDWLDVKSVRRQWTGPGSNRRPKDFQSFALPAELSVLLTKWQRFTSTYFPLSDKVLTR